MLENRTKMYGVIMKLKIAGFEYVILHAVNEPVLTGELVMKVIVQFLTVNRLKFTFKEFENAIVTVRNGKIDTTFSLKDGSDFTIFLREL